MSTESLKDERPEKGTFESTDEAQEFAANIADSIKNGLKQAPKQFISGAAENFDAIEAESINVKEIKDVGKDGNTAAKGTAIDYRPYGLDDINLRNEIVQEKEKEKKRAIRVESSEDRDVLSEAIQRRLEAKIFGEAKVHEGFHIVNIMQECLKSEDILAYMKKNNCCTCERCQADVLAATLSHLPSMYVVMYKKSTSARISFYHENYKMDILSAIMRAIRDVNEHPHHGHDRIQ
ncbi:Late competence development protein ComFB [Oribacterium sp. KHPX15]|uniref:late competence development ComFB family protein n=1 Tax=Oribacterium sp. KHPX15 TaxID=1855342 RepID=UPI0008951DDD|nr:late competence development ComFB family protein [Oribacterium sp. KHPX15]SEA42698.1 Late competence development protein ComFB [Oribacterium sp. KHPX15]